MVETFQKYGGSGLMLCWFIVAWLYLLIKEKKESKRILFVYAPAVMLIIFFNPLFYGFFGQMSEEDIYFRFLWLVPITMVVGYAIVKIYNTLAENKKTVFIIIAMIMLVISGRIVYTNPLFTKAENEYHVPQAVANICDAIIVDGREVMAVFPEEFLLYVRQYTPYVCMPYGRDVLKGGYNDLYGIMGQTEINAEELAYWVKLDGCHYIIISEEKKLIGSLEDYDYELFAVIDGYCIYRDTTIYIGL